MSEKAIIVIESFVPAQEGWCAVIALPEKHTYTETVKVGKFFKKEKEITTTVDHYYMPVVFWANAHMLKEDSTGTGRSHSAIIPLVNAGEGIQPAMEVDGYIGLLSPDDTVEETQGMQEAIDNWRMENELTVKTNSSKRSMMN